MSGTIQAGIVQDNVCVSAFLCVQRTRVCLWISEMGLARVVRKSVLRSKVSWRGLNKGKTDSHVVLF